jgi:glycerol-3-phosphate dehydrogenase (NAD+)
VISVSKGLYMKTLEMMCDVIPAALERDQPVAFLSGPSFAREVCYLDYLFLCEF